MRIKTSITIGIVALVMFFGVQGTAQAQDLCPPTDFPKGCPPHRPQFDAGLCYPPCAPGFTGVGPMCWGSGLAFFSSYGRGAGTIPTACTAGMQYHLGLCHTPCRAGAPQ